MSSTQHTRRVFVWLNQIASDKNVPSSAFRVAYVIAQHINEKTGEAWPSTETIGDLAGLYPSSVRAMIVKLVEHGHLAVVWGRKGRGHPNRYSMTVKPQQAAVLASRTKPQPSKLKPQPDDHKTAAGCHELLRNHLKNHQEGDFVAPSADDLTPSPVISTGTTADDVKAAPAFETVVPEQTREAAKAAGLIQQMLEAATADDFPLSPALQSNYDEAKMNPTVLHIPIPISKYDDHDYLNDHKHHLKAPRFKIRGRGVMIENDSGVIIGTFDHLPKSQPGAYQLADFGQLG